MDYYYSPHTKEHINTTNPAPWMSKTTVKPPAYDPTASAAFFRDGEWTVEHSAPQPSALDAAKINAKARIDIEAGEARAAFPSAGTLVDAEYYRAEAEARAFAAADYPDGAAPASVQSWADVMGWTAQQAADDIIATADGWYQVLDAIRAARLAGKAAIDAAPDIAAINAASAATLATLATIRPT